MKMKLSLTLLALVLTLAPKVALADLTTTYNTNAPGGTGFYNGSGNTDGHFTVTTATYTNVGSISLALRGTNAYVGTITPTNNSEYDCTISMPACSFQWAVFTTGTFHIASFTYAITVNDLTKATSATSVGHFDPSKIDDSYWTAAIGGHSVPPGLTAYNAAYAGFENSEQFAFAFLQVPLNWQVTDRVLVTLSAAPVNSALADPSVTIGFNTPVPEPSSIVLTLTMVGLFGVSRLRRRQKA